MVDQNKKDRRVKLPADERKYLIHLREKGWTYRALARRFGISPSRAAAIVYDHIDNKRIQGGFKYEEEATRPRQVEGTPPDRTTKTKTGKNRTQNTTSAK